MFEAAAVAEPAGDGAPRSPGASPMGAVDLAQARRMAAEGLSAAQESISAKGLMDLRSRTQVPGSAQAVVAAAARLVAGIDEPAPLDQLADSAEQAQAALQKPGQFVSSLRRFPYEVDAGRLPEYNPSAASQLLAAVDLNELQGEVVVLRLHRWVLAAFHYIEISSAIGAGAGGGSPAAQAAAAAAAASAVSGAEAGADAPPLLSPTRAAAASSPVGRIGGPPISPAGARRSSGAGTGAGPGGRQGARGPPAAAAAASGPRPSGAARTSTGSSAAGRPSPGARSSPGRPGGLAASSSILSSTRSSLASSAAPVRGALAGRRGAGGAGAGGLGPASRAGGASFGGQSGGYPTGLSLQDMKDQLEQLRKDAREAKATEAKLKASMTREDEKQRKEVLEKDRKERIEAARQETESMHQYIEEKRKQTLVVELEENRDFQESKRAIRDAEHEEELKGIHEDYIDSKENAHHRVEMRKVELAAQEAAPIEEHFENYRVLAEHNQEEKRRQEVEIQEARMAEIASDLMQSLAQAHRERDLAMESLTHVRSSQGAPLPLGASRGARAT